MSKSIRAFSAALVMAISICLFISPASAQVHFGLKAGFSLSQIDSVPEFYVEGYPWKTRKDPTGGIFFSLGIIKDVSFQPEILFIRKGARIIDSENNLEVGFNFDYVEIPVTLKIDLRLEGLEVTPSLYFGPFIGFSRAASIVIRDPFYTEKLDIKEEVEKTEYGLTCGLLLTQKWGIGKFLVDLRYDFGLSNILKPNLEWAESVKTRTLLIMIGYSF